jgi:hypothetical protein
VGRVKCLLSLALHPDWCISVLIAHISHQVPGPNEREATVPVQVFWVQPDVNSLFHYVVHISCRLIQDEGATEISVLPCLKSKLHHGRLLCECSQHSCITVLMMGTEPVPGMSMTFNQLTQLTTDKKTLLMLVAVKALNHTLPVLFGCAQFCLAVYYYKQNITNSAFILMNITTLHFPHFTSLVCSCQ